MAQVQTRVTRRSGDKPLESWAVLVSLILEFLRKHKILDELPKRFAVARSGGYIAFDLLMTGMMFFVAEKAGGIKGFCRDVKPFMVRLAALAGLKRLPGSASLSRLLAATDRLKNSDESVSWLLAEGSACRDLLRSTLGQARDALGRCWSLFDFDPNVDAVRERALPELPDTPDATRRAKALCAPGHAGRKRGETQYSTAMLSHAGTGLWLQATVSAGNTLFAQALAVAAATVARVVAWAGLPAEFTLVRFDGAGGHHPAISAVVQHGLHYLVRLGSCLVLEQPGVLDMLATADWQDVPDSGSGPRRQATELGFWALSKDLWLRETPEQPALRSRLIVSRFPARDGKKHGAGVVYGAWQYEVFATDIGAVAWPAGAAVALYYGRCGQENAFGTSAAELRLGDVHSFTLHGQRIMTAIGMWCANLRRVMAAEHAGDLGEPLPQTARPVQTPAETKAAELPAEALPAAEHAEAPAQPAVLDFASQAESGTSEDAAALVPALEPAALAEPAVAQANEQAQLIAQPPAGALAAADRLAGQDSVGAGPSLRTSFALSVACVAGMAIPLHNLRRLSGSNSAYAIYRGNSETCGVCTQRQGCTHRTDSAYRREFGVPVAAELLGVRDAILAQARAGRKASHTPGRGSTSLPAATRQAPRKSAMAQPTMALVPSVPTRTPRLVPCPPPAPGPWLPDHAQLYMPALVAAWRSHLGRMAIEVEVIQAVAPAHRRPWVRDNAARRQCRRRTWAERRAYNTTSAKVKVNHILYG